jgi:hypothetical protein
MADDRGLWSKVWGEVRNASERARRTGRRAVDMGVLRVDLISLRRDRSRALADLGARALAHWKGGAPEAIASDSEAIRLRERIASIDADIEAKRAEYDRLREAGRTPARASDSPARIMTASNVP